MGERLPCKQEVTSSNLVFSILVAMRPGVTPVPIPNTMVKTRAAESTALETVWEDRRLPGLKEKNADRSAIRFLKQA